MWVDGIKSFGGLATLIGILVTAWIGVQQLKITRTAREDERLERAVTRLESVQQPERLVGLAGVEQFLNSPDDARQEDALTYLINAAVVEKDPTVRSAILDAFRYLGDAKLSKLVLNRGLLAARDRNRAMLRELTDQFIHKQADAKKRLVDSQFTEIPIGNPSPDEVGSLEASGQIIAALIRAGAKVDDLSNIYCVDCNFSSSDHPAQLRNVKFETAFLRRANFTGADLSSASFKNADLILANFTSANLHKADFSEDTPVESWTVAKSQYSGDLTGTYGPIFACADLSSADFSGRVLFGLIFGDPVYGGSFVNEFYNANLRDARMEGIRFLVAIPQEIVPPVKSGTIQFIPNSLSPTTSNLGVKTGEAVTYYGQTKYEVWEDGFAAPGMVIKPIDGPYRRDWHISLSSLFAAKNLADAQLPEPLKTFIEQNAPSLSKPYRSYDCKGGRSADISDLYSPSDRGPKNMVP